MIYITKIKKSPKKEWILTEQIRFKVFEVEDATILENSKHNITILCKPGAEYPEQMRAIEKELTALAKAGKFTSEFLGELRLLA